MGSIEWDEDEEFSLSEDDESLFDDDTVDDEDEEFEEEIVVDNDDADAKVQQPKPRRKKRAKKPKCSKVDTKYVTNISMNAIKSAASNKRLKIANPENITLTIDNDTIELLDELVGKIRKLIPDSNMSRSSLIRAAIWYVNYMREKKKVDWVTLTKWRPPWD